MPVTSFRVVGSTDDKRDADGAAKTDADRDVALVLALRRREPAAELAAWNRFSPGVDATLRRMLGPGGHTHSNEGADRCDLLQEVFLRFFRRIETLREPAAVRGFLTAICLRVVQTEIASRRRRRWLRLTDTGAAPDVADGASPSQAREAREAIARYYRLLERLNGRDRSLFVARTIEGLTLEEVAAAHEISVSTAQRRIARASRLITTLVRRDPLLLAFAEGGAP
ncbi:MAG: polymerase sigma factor [Myxococcales bacterium]|nr:polymerase sigma factor [Myxococcales bacterium]